MGQLLLPETPVAFPRASKHTVPRVSPQVRQKKVVCPLRGKGKPNKSALKTGKCGFPRIYCTVRVLVHGPFHPLGSTVCMTGRPECTVWFCTSTRILHTRTAPLPFSSQADWARCLFNVRSSEGKLTHGMLIQRLDATFTSFCMRMSSLIDPTLATVACFCFLFATRLAFLLGNRPTR
jgi:hypothetical protein